MSGGASSHRRAPIKLRTTLFVASPCWATCAYAHRILLTPPPDGSWLVRRAIWNSDLAGQAI